MQASLGGQEDGKDGAASWSDGAGANAETAAVLFDEFARDPKAEAGAGIFFRREEGFEDAVEMLGGNALSGVRDGDANALARGIAGVGGGVCFKADRVSPGACVEAIGQEIGEDLAKLPGGAENLTLRGGVDDEGNAESCRPAGVEVADLVDDAGRLEVRGDGLSIEAQGLAGDVSNAAEFGLGLRKEVTDLVEFVRMASDIDEISEALEGIVDLVCDRGGQAAGGSELFGTHERALGHATLGDVAEDEDDADHLAGAVTNRRAAVVDADLRAVFGNQVGMVGETNDYAEAAYLVDWIFDGGASVFIEDWKDRVQDYSARLSSCQPVALGDTVHKDDAALGVAGYDGVADTANGGVEPLLSRIGFVAALLDLSDLLVVGGGEQVKDSPRLPCENTAMSATARTRTILAFRLTRIFSAERSARRPMTMFRNSSTWIADCPYPACAGACVVPAWRCPEERLRSLDKPPAPIAYGRPGDAAAWRPGRDGEPV